MYVITGPSAGLRGFSFRINRDIVCEVPRGEVVELPDKDIKENKLEKTLAGYLATGHLTEVDAGYRKTHDKASREASRKKDADATA